MISKNYKIPIKVLRIHPDAVIPFYATEGSAGFDFYTVEEVVLEPNEVKIVKTGLKMEIPVGFELQMRPRSGVSLKTSIRLANSPGTIDSDYRGEIGILAWNTGNSPITISKGERIAQGILAEVPTAFFIDVTELSTTDRGEGGFGSTGK